MTKAVKTVGTRGPFAAAMLGPRFVDSVPPFGVGDRVVCKQGERSEWARVPLPDEAAEAVVLSVDPARHLVTVEPL